jgi:hypothetical protein
MDRGSGCESAPAVSYLNLINPYLAMGWRGCRRRGAGALQMAAGGQRFVTSRFGRTLEGPDFILIPPDDGTVGVFLTIGFFGLLQVVGVPVEDHAGLFCV